MRSHAAYAVTCLAILWATSSSHAADPKRHPQLFEAATEHFRGMDLRSADAWVEDRGNTWWVTYVPRDNRLGKGLPVVEIDKRTNRVINVYREEADTQDRSQASSK